MGDEQKRNTMTILCCVYHDKNNLLIACYAPWNCHERRQQKVTQEQKEIYCSFMEQNPIFSQTKHTDKSVRNIWETLVDLLNSTSGATHRVEEWKKVFDNWRYAVTHKLRLQKAELKKTGGGSPKNIKPIDKLEERAMACWGRIVVDGHKNVAVAGCSKFEPSYELEEDVAGDQQMELGYEVESLIYLDASNEGVGTKEKRQRRSTTQTLDDDFYQFLRTSEEKKQVQADLICSKLDNVVTSIEALTVAQNATTAAIEKLTMAIKRQ